MRYEPDYTIDLKDAKIPLLFNSWTFKNYSEKVGVELDGMIEHIKSGKVTKGDNLLQLLEISANSYQKFNGTDKKYDELDPYRWVDELGGFHSLKIIDLYKKFVAKLFDIPAEKIEVEEAGETAGEDAKKKTTTD